MNWLISLGTSLAGLFGLFRVILNLAKVFVDQIPAERIIGG